MKEVESLDLFTAALWPTRTRTEDPLPSHQAEKEMRESGAMNAQRQAVLAYVRMYPGDTAREYDAAKILPEGAFHRRLVELMRVGLVRRGEPRKCRVGNRSAHTWLPVER